MVDTLNFTLTREEVGSTSFLTSISPLLTKPKEEIDISTEEVAITGWVGAYKARATANQISLFGSLTNYYLPNNLYTLTRMDIASAIEKLSDELHLPIKQASVHRLDLAQNFIMTHPPRAYYPKLGVLQHYHRLPQPDSVLYKNSQRQLIFYNKIGHAKSKRFNIPYPYIDANVLRYEYRLTSRLKSQLNIPHLTTAMISDPSFYSRLIDLWRDAYLSINKYGIFKSMPTQMTSTQSHRALLAVLAHQTDPNNALAILDQWNTQNLFSTNREYYRAKKELSVLLSNAPSDTDELIRELDNKVKNRARYYR